MKSNKFSTIVFFILAASFFPFLANATVVISSQDKSVIAGIIRVRSNIEAFKRAYSTQLESLGYRGKPSISQKLSSLVYRYNGLHNESTLIGPHSSQIELSETRLRKIYKNGENWSKVVDSSSELSEMRHLLDESAFITERIALFDQAHVALLIIGADLTTLLEITKNNLGLAHSDFGRRYTHEPAKVDDALEELEKQVLFVKGVSLLAIEYELLNSMMPKFFKTCRKGPPHPTRKTAK